MGRGRAAVFAVVVCVAARRQAWVAGLASLGVALGALVQLRLGIPAWRLTAFAAAACVLFVLGARGGRSEWLAGLLADPYRRRLVALGALGLGLGLRAVTVLGPSAAAGTLPLVPVQVGELTRYLVAAGVAVAISEAGGSRREPWRGVDRRFRLVVGSLAGTSVLVLVALSDLGPAAVLGLAMALVHVRGLRVRWAVAASVGVAIAVPVLVGVSSTAAVRVREVVDPGAQLSAALTAAYSGGLVGPGPGRSPLVEGVPAIGSDYAVAALVADLGAAVVVPVLLGLGAGYVHLLRAAASRSGTRNTVAVTLGAMLAGQAAWNALGAFAVLPLTGLNQPFVGVSGASLSTSALVLGVVVGVIDRTRAGGTRPVAGARVIDVVAGVGAHAVSLLLVVAAALLAFGPRPLDDADQLRMPRGTIWTADGRVVSRDGRQVRVYPDGGLYADLGFHRWNYTHRGLDAVRADTLTCGGHLGTADRIATLLHPVCRPADVVTTVDSRSQAAVAAALAGRSGEAVLLDTRSGGVLALYSSPSPAAGDPSAARLRQGPPGSAMKIVTAAAALLRGVDFAGAPAGSHVSADGQRLANDESTTCPATDAATALTYSCNSVYGWAADRVGAGALARVARTYFGADGPYPLDGIGATGLDTGLGPATGLTGGQVARTGIGQESVRSSVLGIAVATAVVADAGGGPTRWPHLTAAICAGVGPEIPGPMPVVGLPLPAEVGRTIVDGMHAAVRSGTARALRVPAGVDAAAKTGTAQLDGGGIDSWITVIVDHRYVLTLVVHRPGDDGAAIDVASRILPSIPRVDAPTPCPHYPSPNEESHP